MDFFDDDVAKNKQKKAKSNGFMNFVFEIKRKQGISDLIEAQMVAGKLWEKMDNDERIPYTQNSVAPQKIKKFTTTGISFDELETNKREEQKEKQRMLLTIEDMLQFAVEEDRLDSLTFYFFSTNYFCQTIQGDIFPAEIAMSKFSLERGVYETFHTLFNPGSLPLGYSAEAREHSQATHKYDLPPDHEGETDYDEIFRKIKEFISSPKQKKLPPIFVDNGFRGEEINAARLTLKKISAEADNGVEFSVYPIENLLISLQKKRIRSGTNPPIPFYSPSITRRMMTSDRFSYSNIGCSFHSVNDSNPHCSLSKVKRWGYTIAELCLDPDEIIPGYHLPECLEYEAVDNFSSSLSYRDSDLSDCLTDSLRSIRINSQTTMNNSSSDSLPPDVDSNARADDSQFDIQVPSVNDSADSIHSFQNTEVASKGKAGTDAEVASEADVSDVGTVTETSEISSFSEDSLSNYSDNGLDSFLRRRMRLTKSLRGRRS